jgi:hypothetical protein
VTRTAEDTQDEFYIVDVRKGFDRKPYVTLWRPDNAGYAYPLPWAGRYTRAEIEDRPGYHYRKRDGKTRTLDRYPVPCEAVERHAVAPAKGLIDGDAGPVVPNTAEVRAALRRARWIPEYARTEKKVMQ